MQGLISVEEAMARVLALAKPLGCEKLALEEAAGRFMCEAAVARRDQPPFAASAMDGYALPHRPALGEHFTVIGEAGAGHGFSGKIGAGEALRIFTGAPLPQGAQAVALQEDVSRTGDQITITGLSSGDNIRAQGQDFKIGASLGPRWLRAGDLALLAAMNIPQVACARRPKVAVIATGDELVLPGETPRPDQIISSNGYALKPMAESAGAELRLLPIARDSEADLIAAFDAAEGADVIVTIGGASVGDHDHVAAVAAKLGMERAFYKVALRPGKPLMAGRLGKAVMLGLPGNPVSAVVCGHLFLLPLLRALQGDPAPLPKPRRAKLGLDLPANGPRAHYMRARLSEDGETLLPEARQDSALLWVLAEADALLIRPPHEPAQPKGASCLYLPI